MDLTINDLVDALQQDNSSILIFYQDDVFVSFTNLRDMAQKLSPMAHSSFVIDTQDTGLLEWQIVKLKSYNGFRIYLRPLKQLACRNGVFEMPEDRMEESEHYSEYFTFIPGEIYSVLWYDTGDARFRFRIHEDIVSIVPLLWEVAGLTPKMIEFLMKDDSFLEPWLYRKLLGHDTLSEALRAEFPNTILFKALDSTVFEIGYAFAEAQQYIKSEDLEEYVNTVRRNLTNLEYIHYYDRSCDFSLADFIAQAFLWKEREKGATHLHPKDDNEFYRDFFLISMYDGNPIPFSKSHQEVMDDYYAIDPDSVPRFPELRRWKKHLFENTAPAN